MKLGPEWKIGKDNSLTVNPYEMRQLKTRAKLTDRTLHVECPKDAPVMDAATAKMIAVMAMPNAVIGRCSKINVRGPRWHYEFDVRTLNGGIQRQWGRRTGMVQNPLEQQLAGCFFDETRQLFQVPPSYNVRERVRLTAAR